MFTLRVSTQLYSSQTFITGDLSIIDGIRELWPLAVIEIIE